MPATAAAFFDLDRTLMEGSSAFQFGRAAYRAGLMNRRRLLADGWANVRFRLRGSTDADTHALRDRISASLAGARVRRYGAASGRTCWPGSCPASIRRCCRSHTSTRTRAGKAYIVTAASQDLAELLAHVLALDGAIGSTFSKVQNGVYTGEPTGLFVYRSEKARAIQELAEREGIDLSESYAYSDSESDLPMLQTVGHPVVVNPDRALARAARQGGWQILRFDRLRRRLMTGAALAGAAAVGGAGSAMSGGGSGRRLRPWPLNRG